MTEPIKRTRTRLNAVMFALFMDELVSGPCTLPGLIEATGLHRTTVRGVLKALHARKLVHRSSWDRDARGAPSIAVWSWGAGKDAKRPVKTQATVNREWRARQALRAFAGALASNDEQRAAA